MCAHQANNPNKRLVLSGEEIMTLDEEIAEAVELLNGSYSNPYTAALSERHKTLQYLYTHPHLLFALGYDEARVFHESDDRSHPILERYCQAIGRYFTVGPKPKPFDSKPACALLRQQHGTLWSLPDWIHLVENADLWATKAELEIVREDGNFRRIDLQELITVFTSVTNANGSHSKAVFNNIWLPPSVRREDVCAFDYSSSVLNEIRKGNRLLTDVRSRELEEIVAELLAIKGMKVLLTPRSNDGGRDIIAEGEFFPGLLCKVAVEVTGSPAVGLPKLSSALYRNRHFPVVMVATTGHFTAGVLRERREPDNCFRLVLADGDCLASWVNSGVPAFPR
jgi:hypothetical protein